MKILFQTIGECLAYSKLNSYLVWPHEVRTAKVPSEIRLNWQSDEKHPSPCVKCQDKMPENKNQ